VQTAKLNPALPVALALAGESKVPIILDLPTLARTGLDQARPSPDLVVWSPSGSAVALLYRDAQWVQIFTLESNSFQFHSEFPAPADQAAVADDGSALLALSQDGLSLYQGGGAAVLSRDPGSSFTFLAGAALPAFWTGGQLTIAGVSLPFVTDDNETLLLASPASGRIVAVRSGAGRVTALDSSGQVIDDHFCNCPVSGLESLGRPGAVRLATSGDGPLWIADSSSALPLFFVPAPVPQAEDSRHRRFR
jgi:hypothetical protein